jgi:hypothetical protein
VPVADGSGSGSGVNINFHVLTIWGGRSAVNVASGRPEPATGTGTAYNSSCSQIHIIRSRGFPYFQFHAVVAITYLENSPTGIGNPVRFMQPPYSYLTASADTWRGLESTRQARQPMGVLYRVLHVFPFGSNQITSLFGRPWMDWRPKPDTHTPANSMFLGDLALLSSSIDGTGGVSASHLSPSYRPTNPRLGAQTNFSR